MADGDEQGVAGVTPDAMPDVAASPRGRPREDDPQVVSQAALAFGTELVSQRSPVVEGCTAEEFRDDLVDVLPIFDRDGMELAQAMNRRYGHDLDTILVEAMSRWHDHLSSEHAAHVRRWVEETSPAAPFDVIARVTFLDHGRPVPALAYRDPRHDPLALCLVVPQGKESDYIRGGLLQGGRIIPWEDVVEAAPGSEADVALYRATSAERARRADASALSAFAHGREQGFQKAAREASARLGPVGGQALRDAAAAAIAVLAAELSSPAFDPYSKAAAETIALLARLRAADATAAFASDQAA